MSRRRKGLFQRLREFITGREEIEEAPPVVEPEPEPEPSTIIERVIALIRDIIPDELPFAPPPEPEEDEIEEDWEDVEDDWEEEEPLWNESDLVFLQLQSNLTYNSSAGDWYKDNPDRTPEIIGEDSDGLLYNKTFRHDTADYRGDSVANMPKEEILDPENMQKLVKLSMKDTHNSIYDGSTTSHEIKEMDKPYATFRLKDDYYVFYRTPKRQTPRVKQITDKERISELRDLEADMGE